MATYSFPIFAGGNGSELIELRLLYNISEVWRWSLCDFAPFHKLWLCQHILLYSEETKSTFAFFLEVVLTITYPVH